MLKFFQRLDPNATIHHLYYLVWTTSEVFCMGYAGNSLKLQSERMGEALFRCPWHLCGGPFRRDILMMLKSTMTPMVWTGGKFFVMDNEKVKAVRFIHLVTNIL